jgi:superfamily II DNA or RNA helicase
MELIERNSYIYLSGASSVELMAIKGHFSLIDPKYEMMKKRNPGMEWDGKVRFYSLWKETDDGNKIYRFRVGHLQKLLKFLNDEELSYTFERKVELDPIPFAQHLMGDDKKPISLDETQIEASKALLASRRAVIELGTGSGKTEIVLNAFRCVQQVYPDVKMLLVVPKLNLLMQTIERIKRRLPGIGKIGQLGEGVFDVKGAAITVGTFQTASAGKHITLAKEIREWLLTVDMLVLDEAHHTRSDQGQDIINTTPSKWLWAVSAKVTFFKKENEVKHLVLESLFGPPAFKGFSAIRTCPTTVVMHRDRRWEGQLSEFHLFNTYVDGMPVMFKASPEGEWFDACYRGPDIDGKVDCELNPDLCKLNPNKKRVPDKKKFGFYQKVGDEWQAVDTDSRYTICMTTHDIGIVNFTPRNKWAVEVAKQCKFKDEPFVISYRRARHPVVLIPKLRKAGLNVVVVDGDLSGPEQLEMFEKVKNREIDGIMATYSIVAEGVDIPNLVHLIKLDGIGEEQVLTQQRGRVQRVFTGKKMGYLHIPYDRQHQKLLRTSMSMSSYFKKHTDAKVVIRDWK